MRILLLFLSILLTASLAAQSVTGRVTNQLGEPVPYANILVQELGTGTTADFNGDYVLNLNVEGSYRIIYSSLGHESKKIDTVLGLKEQSIDVVLQTSGVELEEITIKASAKDPAYGIIRKVVENKSSHLRAAASYRTKVYVKAREDVERHARKRKSVVQVEDDPEAAALDPFAAEEKARKALLTDLNLVEMEVMLNFQQPRQYKEERTAYKAYGQTRGLFIPRFGETDFNFYRNMVNLTGISDAPVISPLSTTGVLSYKFKLESTDLEGSQIVYQIRVKPRKSGNNTCSGTLWINEGSWTINRLDLTFSKYSLKFFDDFRLEQDYVQYDSVWTVNRQAFNYVAKAGKQATFRGTTTLSYSDYEHNYPFPARFFGNEVAVTEREAYQRDTAYWKNSRTVALTPEEAKMITVRDSVEAVLNSKEYQDSLQARYNKITPLELVWDGVGFRNNEKKSHLYVGSLPELIDFSVVGGWRVGPSLGYTRRYPSGKLLRVNGSANYGFKNKDLLGGFNAWHRYDPFRNGGVSFTAGRAYESIFPFDAFLNQLRASNYIKKESAKVGHEIEIVNGLFLNTNAELAVRTPITGLETSSFLSGLVEDDDVPQSFEGYEAFITNTILSYTPGLKYMREPDRKIRLGSKFPTFRLLHRKGWKGPLGSDIDFDYVEASISQNLIFGVLGNSNYELKAGKFINTRDLRFIDLKRFRESDPILMSDPSQVFNVLDTSLTTSNLFVEFHHIHHFNGALVNNIPLLRKTRIKTIAGAGFLYLPTEKYRYQEIFVGLERVFKIGARRRLRLGGYAVLGDANDGRAQTSFKISFDLIDLWKRDWSF